MAGSDPKTNRALGQPAARRTDLDSDEDPLVELARIVSEDGGFAGPKLQKAKMTRHEQNSRDNSSDGLEAELLQELETAFPLRDEPATSRPEAIPHANATNSGGAARTQVAPVRRPVDEDPDPDQLLRSIEEQLSQFERRQANRFSSTMAPTEPVEVPTEAEEQSFDAQVAREEPAPLPFGAPRKPDALEDEWQRRPTSRIRPFAESAEPQDEPAQAAPESVFEVEPPPAPRSEYRFRGPANADWDRRDTAPREETPDDLRFDDKLRVSRERAKALRYAEPAPTAEPEASRESAPVNGARRGRTIANAAAQPPHRERLAATFSEFDDEPQAPEPAASDLADIEATLSRDFEQRLPEDSSNGVDKWQDGDAPAEEPAVAAAIAPGHSRRAAAARAAAQQRSRSRFGMLVAAVILVVVIGGGAAFYLRSSESTPSGPPPVIAAEQGEVRVPASSDKPATETESAGDAVYNRVAGATPPANEQVVENSEEPREVARIVLPPPQSNADNSVVRPVGVGENTAAPAEAVPDTASPPPAASAPAATEQPANAETEIGPRRVPTFIVKADGSIVATGESSAPSPAPASAPDLTADTTKPIEPVPVPTVAIAEANTPTDAATPASPPPAVATTTPPAPAASDDLTTRPTIDEPPPEVTAAPAEPPAAPAPPAADAAPAEVASVAPSETQAPPPPTTASGGYLVQISSQRTMEQAQSAYAAAQKRFPSLLGSLTPQIREADLGTKGIYYRVKVGPWATRDEAVKVCESLRAAGGSCLITR